MPLAIGGISSGDFKETSARVQLFHVVTRNSLGLLTPDAFTQNNPPVVTTQASTTLSGITKKGALGGTVAFTRPDFANGYHGGPNSAAYTAGCQPLGLFLNDAVGNPFENTPGVASGRGPYVCGSGSTVGLSLYETKVQITFNTNGAVAGSPASVVAGAALTYAAGDKLYAGANGLVTKVVSDAFEFNVGTAANNSAYPIKVLGIVKVAPDANSSLLVVDLWL